MRIVEGFTKASVLFAALSAAIGLLAATGGANAGSHRGTSSASKHAVNSPPIIAPPGKDHHRGHHRHHWLGFGFARAYWLVDGPCTVKHVQVTRYTDVVVIRRTKSCADVAAQATTYPGY